MTSSTFMMNDLIIAVFHNISSVLNYYLTRIWGHLKVILSNFESLILIRYDNMIDIWLLNRFISLVMGNSKSCIDCESSRYAKSVNGNGMP